MAQPVTDEQFKQDILDFEGVSVVDFWAEWCTPCRVQGPIVDSLSEKYKDNPKVKMRKLDVDENPETQNQYHVMSIPTLIFYKGGEAVQTLVGLRSEEDIDAVLKDLLE